MYVCIIFFFETPFIVAIVDGEGTYGRRTVPAVEVYVATGAAAAICPFVLPSVPAGIAIFSSGATRSLEKNGTGYIDGY